MRTDSTLVRTAVLMVLVIGLVTPVLAANESDHKIAPWLMARLQRGGSSELLVLLDSSGRPAVDRSLTRSELYAQLSASVRTGHAGLRAELTKRGVAARSFYLVDAVMVRGDLALARLLSARSDVVRLVGNPRVRGVESMSVPLIPNAPTAAEWNITMVRAPEVWSTFNVRGEGIVVASADTGVDWAHPALQNRYVGFDPGAGEADHTYSWHDAFGQYAYPFDDNNHGTHTVGTMVGEDQSNQIGVAPRARWIACRNMDGGFGTPASYIDCMEWSLAPYPPGGDPLVDGRPELAPHVINNSWSCSPGEGCAPETLREAAERMLQAGILMVTSAGNDGPNCSTVTQPLGIYENVFSVGAVDNARVVASFSNRGPVTIDGSGRRKPDLAAPGKNVRSSIPDARYSTMSGTSMAAPHVAGTAALLWSARPQLRGKIALTRCVLERSASTSAVVPNAQECGGIPSTVLPNNVVGHGLLDTYTVVAQPFSDADIAPDVCDCAPADASAMAVPAAIGRLRFTSKTQLVWEDQQPDAGSGTRYDLLRGDVQQLLQVGNVAAAACAAQALSAAQASDAQTPVPGSGAYYLVRSSNVCGGDGWGPGRVNTACD